MGVNGITPFLKRFCPEVLQPIPGRFKELKGKRIVLDGTLITQRFHYGQDPHPHKHIIGWYKLARELRDAGMIAICVFDGKERSEAKSGEVQRRQQARQLVHTRGAIEKGRLQRLEGLEEALREIEEMDEGGRRRVAEMFAGSEVVRKMGGGVGVGVDASVGASVGVEDGVEKDAIGVDDVEGTKKTDILSSMRHGEVLESLYLNYCANMSQLSVLPDIEEKGKVVDEGGDGEGEGELKGISSKGKKKKKGDALETEKGDADADADADGKGEVTRDEEGDKIENERATKAQNELSIQENEIWRDLARVFTQMKIVDSRAEDRVESSTPSIISSLIPLTSTTSSTPSTTSSTSTSTLPSTPTPPPQPTLTSIHSNLTSIHQKSTLMSASFTRRTNSPRTTTYDESKALLRAAGIPCVDAPRCVEAEAFAAGVVGSGMADYVGSEDTDVLIYDSPMLKNLTSRSEPLILIDGSMVRQTLKLTRAEYVDWALLLGTDFTRRVRGVGPCKALEVVRRWGGIEGGLEGGEGREVEEMEDMNDMKEINEIEKEKEINEVKEEKEKEGKEGVESGMKEENEPKELKKPRRKPAKPKRLNVPNKEEYMKQVEIARLIFGRLPGVTEEVGRLMGGQDGVGGGDGVGGVEGVGVVEGNVGEGDVGVVGEGVVPEGVVSEGIVSDPVPIQPPKKPFDWDDSAVRQILKKHRLEFLLFELDVLASGYTLEGGMKEGYSLDGDNGGGFFGDNPRNW